MDIFNRAGSDARPLTEKEKKKKEGQNNRAWFCPRWKMVADKMEAQRFFANAKEWEGREDGKKTVFMRWIYFAQLVKSKSNCYNDFKMLMS